MVKLTLSRNSARRSCLFQRANRKSLDGRSHTRSKILQDRKWSRLPAFNSEARRKTRSLLVWTLSDQGVKCEPTLKVSHISSSDEGRCRLPRSLDMETASLKIQQELPGITSERIFQGTLPFFRQRRLLYTLMALSLVSILDCTVIIS